MALLAGPRSSRRLSGALGRTLGDAPGLWALSRGSRGLPGTPGDSWGLGLHGLSRGSRVSQDSLSGSGLALSQTPSANQGSEPWRLDSRTALDYELRRFFACGLDVSRSSFLPVGRAAVAAGMTRPFARQYEPHWHSK